jgi:hypothetical protein
MMTQLPQKKARSLNSASRMAGFHSGETLAHGPTPGQSSSSYPGRGKCDLCRDKSFETEHYQVVPFEDTFKIFK